MGLQCELCLNERYNEEENNKRDKEENISIVCWIIQVEPIILGFVELYIWND